MAKAPTAKPGDEPVTDTPRERTYPAKGGSTVLNKDGTPKTEPKET